MGPTIQFVRAFLFGPLAATAISVRFVIPDGVERPQVKKENNTRFGFKLSMLGRLP